MLGKLIKNEFVNRGKSVLGIYAGVLGISLLVATLGFFNKDLEIHNQYLDTLYEVTVVTLGVAVYAAVVSVILLSFSDYNKRFFKDQGYLTHTLPVKTINLLIARIICDVAVCISIGVFFPVTICIAARDFKIFKYIAEGIGAIIKSDNVGEIMSELVLELVTMLVGILFVSWMYYVSYAIGHSFSNNKRIISVGIFVLIYIATMFLAGTVGTMFDNSHLSYKQQHVIIDIGLTLLVCLFVAITNQVCKKKLNLE